jgi:HTH-type transcriptional regulator/antitoxin HigA
MELKPIRTRTEYKAALREIEGLMDAAAGSPKADKLEVLAMLVEQYEAKHYPIPAPDPIDFLQYAMEARGLSRKDLEPYIGSRGRVAEVLNRVRPLSLAMIRNLSEGLKLPADVLIMDYQLRKAV